MDAKLNAKLDEIIPGKTYPLDVVVNDNKDGKPLKIRFVLNSYFVGMYCAVYVGDCSQPIQTADHDNIKVVRSLKKDLIRAVEERGAKVEIGTILPVRK